MASNPGSRATNVGRVPALACFVADREEPQANRRQPTGLGAVSNRLWH